MRSTTRRILGGVFWSSLLCTAGCTASDRINPTFPLTHAQARRAIKEMQAAPVELARPVVVVAGFADPGFAVAMIRSRLAGMVGDRRVIGVWLAGCDTFEECRDKVIDEVGRAFPTADPERTTEVDVVGNSMGGLVARYAAGPAPGAGHVKKRLRIARLFTISSPLRGADMAEAVPPSPLVRDMRPGSAFLRRLNSGGEAGPGAGVPYPVYSYVRLGDMIVGSANAAMPGDRAWWVDTPVLEGAHLGAFNDQRILADIARRLRGEPAYSISPPAPLPEGALPGARE